LSHGSEAQLNQIRTKQEPDGGCLISYPVTFTFNSDSLSQTKSPFSPHRDLCLVCHAFPQSESQPNGVTNKTNPQATTNLTWKTTQHHQHWKGKQKEKRTHQKADAISTPEVLQLFDQLLAVKNPSTSINQINQLLAAYTKTSSSTDTTVFCFFTRLAQAEGTGPDGYTYMLMMEFCARLKWVNLMFGFSGTAFQRGSQSYCQEFQSNT
jgi:hypothetical protein